MNIQTIPATIEDGKISLPADIALPNGTKVFVLLVTNEEPVRTHHIYSPRLVNKVDYERLKKTVLAE